MKEIKRAIGIQYFVFDKRQMDGDGNWLILGLNGCGKSATQDLIQLVMNGADGRFIRFNAQGSEGKSKRDLKGYCLGMTTSGEGESAKLLQKRPSATTYAILVFGDDETDFKLSAGLVMQASNDEPKAEIRMRFVLPGVMLTADDCVELAENGDEYPLEPEDFESRIRTLANQVGRTPTINNQPKAYLGQLYQELAPPGATIDIPNFLRTFQKSLELKNIESVDEYMRHHIVPSGGIDIEAFGQEIRRFNDLQQTIQDTQDRIERMGGIRRGYEKAERHYVNSVALEALAAIYDSEAAAEQINHLEEQMEAAEKAYEGLNEDHAAAKVAEKRLGDDIQSLREQISQDESLCESQSLQKRLGEVGDLIDSQAAIVVEPLRDLLRGYDTLNNLNDAPALPGEVRQAARTLREASDLPANSDVDQTAQAAARLIGWLIGAACTLEKQAEQARDHKQAIDGKLQIQKLLVDNLEGGGSVLHPDTLRALDEFRQAGIHAQPLCELIEVTAPEWRPAIEAYLGSQLEDLVVEDGREDDAVRLMRGLTGQRVIYNRKVVQPRHLTRHLDRAPGDDEVASMMRAENSAALAYVRQAMAGLKKADSEAELGREKKALTRDGMVSSGGGTQRKRLSDQPRIGRRDNREALQQARFALKGLITQASEADQEVKGLNRAIRTVEGFQDESALSRKIQEPLSRLANLTHRRSVDESTLKSIADDEGKKLLNNLQLMIEQEALQSQTIEQINKNLGKLEEKISGTRGRITTMETELRRLNAAQSALMNHPDLDTDVMDQRRQQIDEQKATDRARAEHARDQRTSAKDSHTKAAADADALLAVLAREDNISIADKLNNWRKAMAWLTAEIDRLEASALQDYKSQADEALTAAKGAFRRDIAYKLREQILEMRLRIDDLNRILEKTPEFSNRERYKFKADPKAEHRALREFVMSVSDSESDDLFNMNGQGPSSTEAAEAMEALQAFATDPELAAGRVPSVLTDYREFYAFDLAIIVDGKEKDRLSARTGLASGGEHRTPYYVISGAALAAALRLDHPKAHLGAGFMLLDEAFHNIDDQNMQATEEFLRKLGLQLIMAGPPSEEAKLGTIADTIWYIGRNELEPWMDQVKIKEAGKALLKSDDPRLHPELLQRQLAEWAADE